MIPITVIHDNETLFQNYQKLKRNDIICGRVRLKPGQEYLLLDLLERGIRLIPPATAQLASRSKVFQTQLLSRFMLPGTITVHDQHSLLCVTTTTDIHLHNEVVLKRDKKNGGIGIHRFRCLEDLYNQVGGGGYPFPFVVQPFRPHCRDVRVVILGDDYVEAYERRTCHNFRHNLHCGGESIPYKLTDAQLELCRQVMQRGAFPYAHIDLLLDGEECWLTEINLRGGLRGAKLCGREYIEAINRVHRNMLDRLQEMQP